MILLQENPSQLERGFKNVLVQYDSAYAQLINTVLQIAVLRIRPLIDQGQTDLASQYLQAVIDGSIDTIDFYVGGKAEANLVEPSRFDNS